MTPSTITSHAADPVRPSSRAVSVDVVILPEPCYRCGAITRSIVGFLAPPALSEHPDGFVDFEVLAPLLLHEVSAAQLARWRVGPIKMRRSRYRPEGYLSNGCISCDAIQGWFPLHEGLLEFLAEGGDYGDLLMGHLTVRESDLRSAADPAAPR